MGKKNIKYKKLPKGTVFRVNIYFTLLQRSD